MASKRCKTDIQNTRKLHIFAELWLKTELAARQQAVALNLNAFSLSAKNAKVDASVVVAVEVLQNK